MYLNRCVAILGSIVLLSSGEAAIHAAPKADSTPANSLTYELQINGESFLVDANHRTKLKSKEKPGVTYDVAIRIAPMQRKQLKTVQVQYGLPAKLELIGSRDNPSVRISHELGFSLLLGDLGRGLTANEQAEALKALEDSVTATLRESKAQAVDVTEPHDRAFAGSPARGKTIRYRDAKGLGHVCLLYVLAGPKHAVTCVVEYLEGDSDDVLPLIRMILDSVRPVSANR